MQVSSEAQRLMHGGRQPALYRAHSASCSQRAHGYLGYQIVAGAAVVHRLDLAAEGSHARDGATTGSDCMQRC